MVGPHQIMVLLVIAQNTLRMRERKQIFFNQFDLDTAVDVNKSLEHIKLPNSLHKRTKQNQNESCTTYKVMNFNTMILAIQMFFTVKSESLHL